MTVCPRRAPGAIAAARFFLSRSPSEMRWRSIDVAKRRRDRRTTTRSALGGLADLLLVGPLEKAVPDVPELQVELVVDVARVLHLLHDRGDVALHAVLGADHLALLDRLLFRVILALLALDLVGLLRHAGRVDGEAHLAALLQLGADRVGDGARVDVLAGLVLHFLHGDDGQVAAWDDGRWLHRARHGFGDPLQVGRAELVGDGLDAARVAVGGLLLRAARGEQRSGEQYNGFCHGLLLAHQDQPEVDRLGRWRDRADRHGGVLVQHERLPGFLLGRAHAFAIHPAELVGDALHALAVVVQVGVDLDEIARLRAAHLGGLDGGAAAFHRRLGFHQVVHRAHLGVADRAAEGEAGLLEAFLGGAAGGERQDDQCGEDPRVSHWSSPLYAGACTQSLCASTRKSITAYLPV